MEEFLKILPQYGVGGLLAGFIFLIYHRTQKENIEKWEGQTEILVNVIKENTVALTALIELMRKQK